MLVSLRNATQSKHLAFTVAVTLVLLLVPLGGSASANHGDATLDVEPETADRFVGEQHSLTATIDQSNTATAINVDFENEGGDNDTDGDTPESPDLTCDVPANGTTCSVTYTGQTAGSDTWRAWIDHDMVQSTVEADTNEPQDEALPHIPGGTDCPGEGADDPTPPLAEPDCTDVVTVDWQEGPATTLDCDDATGPDTERETNPHDSGSESNEPYTCTARDQFGNATNEAPSSQTGTPTVFGENETGINDPDPTDGASYDEPDYTCEPGSGSNDDGECIVTVTQSEGETGTAEICFWLENQTPDQGATLCADEPTDEAQTPGGADTGNDLADQVEKTWGPTGAASVLDCSPETDSNQTGTGHTITCVATDSQGQTVSGANIDAEATGAGDPDGGDSQTTPDFTCTTGSNGECSFTHSSTATGTTTYRAWIDTDGDQTSDADASEGQDEQQSPGATAEPDGTDVVTKTWQEAPACSDGVDNDGDGQTDFPDDDGCSSADDTSETGTFRRASSVSIRHDNRPHVFKGRVRSGPARCRRGRQVVVKEVRRGRDATEGRDRTNRRGRWRERHNRFGAGRYYARVTRKTFTNQFGDTIVCRPDRSRRIRVNR